MWRPGGRAPAHATWAILLGLTAAGCVGDDEPASAPEVEVLGIASSRPATPTPGLARRMLVADFGPVFPGWHLIAFDGAPDTAPLARVFVPTGFQSASHGALVAGSGEHLRSVRFWADNAAAEGTNAWPSSSAPGRVWVHWSGGVRLLIATTYAAGATAQEIAQLSRMASTATLIFEH